MASDLKEPAGERPSSVQHAFRISLNLTRRVVRRMIEMDQARQGRIWQPEQRTSRIPNAAGFQFSLRVLRRVIRRVVEAGGPGSRLPVRQT